MLQAAGLHAKWPHGECSITPESQRSPVYGVCTGRLVRTGLCSRWEKAGWTQISSHGPQNNWALAGATRPDGNACRDPYSRLQGRPVIGWEGDLWEEGQAAEGRWGWMVPWGTATREEYDNPIHDTSQSTKGFPLSRECLILPSILLRRQGSEKGSHLPRVKQAENQVWSPSLLPASSSLHEEVGPPGARGASPRLAHPAATRAALAQGSTVVTLVSTTCSGTLETEHRLCKEKDLWLAEERGLGAFGEPQGPRPGRQQEKAALNCSRNLPWLETEDTAIRRWTKQEGPWAQGHPRSSSQAACEGAGGRS